MFKFDAMPNWSTPIAPQYDRAFLARFFRHVTGSADCLARRQGRCPGRVLCHDCEWREGRELGE